MVNWTALADRKYKVMEEQARAGTIGAGASAQQAATAAQLAPSAIADTLASAQQRQAVTAGMPGLNAAEIGLRQSQAGLNQVNARGAQVGINQTLTPFSADMFSAADTVATGAPLLNFNAMPQIGPRARPTGLAGPAAPLPTGRGLGVPIMRAGQRSTDPLDDMDDLRFAKGTARVPGKGSPKKDTVKAKLAPGEAVLNNEAADTLGRGLISALNAAGARKMGLL